MIAATSRIAKPKLSLSVSTAAQSTRPSLSLNVPTMPRTPVSPTPISPTARNTRLNAKGFSTFQQPSYAYANSSSSKSILKKGKSSSSGKKLQIRAEPTVYCVTPIDAENTDYYGNYTKMSREERRWTKRTYD